MNTPHQAHVVQIISARQSAVADEWYRAVARTSFTALRAADVRSRLLTLTEHLTLILVGEPFEPAAAQDVGAALAELGYVQPQALGGSLDVLGRQLTGGLSTAQAVAMQPRLAALLGAFAAGFFAACRDIILREQEQVRTALLAARRQAEEAQAARIAAEAAVRVRDEVLSSVAHDLKNPLVSIKGQADLLQRQLQIGGTVDSTRLARSLDRISSTTMRMAKLLDELLDTAQLEGGQPLRLDRESTDLVELARRVVTEAAQTAPQHQMQVDAADAQVVCMADAARIERVLSNLLSNAIKYSPPDSAITLTVRRGGQEDAVVEVQDHGQGIPAEDLPHIFERFHRATNVGSVRGTGIGLWGARQIVMQHGGQIAIDSAVGRGTTVVVSLPCEGAAHEENSATTAQE